LSRIQDAEGELARFPLQRTDVLVAIIGSIEAVRGGIARPHCCPMEVRKLTTALYRQWNRVSRATAQRDLSDLVSRGIVAQQGVGRGTYYVLADSDEAQTALSEAQSEA
jgi:hypothetical protein